jgi:hypothetical protein
MSVAKHIRMLYCMTSFDSFYIGSYPVLFFIVVNLSFSVLWGWNTLGKGSLAAVKQVFLLIHTHTVPFRTRPRGPEERWPAKQNEARVTYNADNYLPLFFIIKKYGCSSKSDKTSRFSYGDGME